MCKIPLPSSINLNPRNKLKQQETLRNGQICIQIYIKRDLVNSDHEF